MLKVMAAFFKLLVAKAPKWSIARYVTKLSPHYRVVRFPSFFLFSMNTCTGFSLYDNAGKARRKN
jgi:hypothetical protein